MNFFLANPVGLWGLLFLPVVLWIHYLQIPARQIRASTLFLLNRVAPMSQEGARVERLSHSVPLWMQLLTVLLLSLILAEPTWIRAKASQRIVVVLDGSASMQAFKEETKQSLQTLLSRWNRQSESTEWTLLESDPQRGTLYQGNDLNALFESYDRWQPHQGTRDPREVLDIARRLTNNQDTILYVTDHEVNYGEDVSVISEGKALQNVGFGMGRVLEGERGKNLKWEVLIRNYGSLQAQRKWWFEALDPNGNWVQWGQSQECSLEPGQSMVLEGEWPEGMSQLWVRLEIDAFQFDDSIPLQRPETPVLKVRASSQDKVAGFLMEMLMAMRGMQIEIDASNESPAWNIDVLALIPHETVQVSTEGHPVASSSSTLEQTGEGHASAIRYVHSLKTEESMPQATVIDPALVFAEDHALVRDLDWMSLVTGTPSGLSLQPEDVPLLWKGNLPLAWLRDATNETRNAQELMLNWDLAESNAQHHPGFLVLIHRFIHSILNEGQSYRAGNFELEQALLGKSWLGKDWWIRSGVSEKPFHGKAPDQPGFFEIYPREKPSEILLRGSTWFADTRESDFTEAKKVLPMTDFRLASLKRSSVHGSPSAYMMLLVFLFLLVSWAWKQKKTSTKMVIPSFDKTKGGGIR